MEKHKPILSLRPTSFTSFAENWAIDRYVANHKGAFTHLHSEPFALSFTGWCDG